MHNPDDVEKGQVVYLYPHSKLAGRWAWMKKSAVVEDHKSYWPLIQVSLTHQGEEHVSYVHRDNVRLRPAPRTNKAEKKEGDMGGTAPEVKVRVMAKPIDNMEGQETLW